jgi:hypothetical protein
MGKEFFDGGRTEITNNEGICYHNTVCGGVKKFKARINSILNL